MVQQQEHSMRVLFEKDGWEIRQLSPTADGVYGAHTQCSPYAYYVHLYKCDSCEVPTPDGIQALARLCNWKTK